VYFGSEKTQLPDVKVELAGYAYEAPVTATSTTGKDGRFSITRIKPGRYWLRARHPRVGHLDVEFRLRSSLFLASQYRYGDRGGG
jgi:protocatechuate 3,4-dioxygenase beta subunit